MLGAFPGKVNNPQTFRQFNANGRRMHTTEQAAKAIHAVSGRGTDNTRPKSA